MGTGEDRVRYRYWQQRRALRSFPTISMPRRDRPSARKSGHSSAFRRSIAYSSHAAMRRRRRKKRIEEEI
eukprot:8668984-Pyramimonas_sp.AAC.1